MDSVGSDVDEIWIGMDRYGFGWVPIWIRSGPIWIRSGLDWIDMVQLWPDMDSLGPDMDPIWIGLGRH